MTRPLVGAAGRRGFPGFSGYRPGRLLTRLADNLHPLVCDRIDDTAAEFHSENGEIAFQAREQVSGGLLMQVASTEFCYPVPQSPAGHAEIVVRHRGLVRRQGIAVKVTKGRSDLTDSVAQSLSADSALRSALMPLDFSSCRLIQDESGWRVTVVPFGASEVVNRFPAYSRYIRLTHAQIRALLAGFKAFGRILRTSR